MLKRIDSLFEKRQKSISKLKTVTEITKESLDKFLKDKFGEDSKIFEIKTEYQSKEHSLSIVTNSKVLANELTIYLPEIQSALQSTGLKFSRILIR